MLSRETGLAPSALIRNHRSQVLSLASQLERKGKPLTTAKYNLVFEGETLSIPISALKAACNTLGGENDLNPKTGKDLAGSPSTHPDDSPNANPSPATDAGQGLNSNAPTSPDAAGLQSNPPTSGISPEKSQTDGANSLDAFKTPDKQPRPLGYVPPDFRNLDFDSGKIGKKAGLDPAYAGLAYVPPDFRDSTKKDSGRKSEAIATPRGLDLTGSKPDFGGPSFPWGFAGLLLAGGAAIVFAIDKLLTRMMNRSAWRAVRQRTLFGEMLENIRGIPSAIADFARSVREKRSSMRAPAIFSPARTFDPRQISSFPELVRDSLKAIRDNDPSWQKEGELLHLIGFMNASLGDLELSYLVRRYIKSMPLPNPLGLNVAAKLEESLETGKYNAQVGRLVPFDSSALDARIVVNGESTPESDVIMMLMNEKFTLYKRMAEPVTPGPDGGGPGKRRMPEGEENGFSATTSHVSSASQNGTSNSSAQPPMLSRFDSRRLTPEERAIFGDIIAWAAKEYAVRPRGQKQNVLIEAYNAVLMQFNMPIAYSTIQTYMKKAQAETGSKSQPAVNRTANAPARILKFEQPSPRANAA
jgi:hypothetical protein